MKHKMWFNLVLVLGLILAGVAANASLQAQSPNYDLTWWTVDGGGGTSSGGGYSLSDTIGQADAGSSTGGDYALGGGFWHSGPAASQYRVYLPLVTK